ncbi:MAG: PEP-CTERM sorting domain-containing protein [Cyanobacteria bacterium J06634_5]
MRKKAFLLPLLASAGATLLSVGFTPSAQAEFSTTLNGRKTADGRAKVDMTFDSAEAGNRSLDATYFLREANASKGLKGTTKGQLSAKIEALTSSMVTLDIKLRNQTSPNFKASIVGMWMGIAQDVSGGEIVSKGEVFRKLRFMEDVPGESASNGICISVAGCNNSGVKVNRGLLALSDSFKVNIYGDFGVSGQGSDFGRVTITDIGSRWKTKRAGSYDVAGVPEPITMLGSGAALAFGALMKRRMDKASADEA